MNTKNFRFYFAALFALIGLLAVLPARAQQYTPTTLFTQGYVLATRASNQVGVINCTKFDEVALQMTFTSSNAAAVWNGAGRESLTFFLRESVDGITYTTNKHALGGTVDTNNVYPVMTITTNISVKSIGYLKGVYITNHMTISDCTNIVVKWVGKTKRQG